MKRIIICAIVLMAVLTSCAQSTPTQVEEKVEEEVTASDAVADAIEEYRSNFNISETEIISQLDYIGSSSAVEKKMKNFDYEIINEKKDDKTTTVTVKITTYPFGATMAEVLDENILLLAMSGEDEDSYDYMMSTLVANLSTLPDKSFTQNVDIYASKRGGEWVVTPLRIHPEFEDAISGGIVSLIQAYNETMG